MLIEKDSNPPINPSRRIKPPKAKNIAGSFLLWFGFMVLFNWFLFEHQ